MRSFRIASLVAVATFGLFFASTAVAQDDEEAMTFGEDEAEEVQEGGDDSEESGESDEGGTMSFGEEEAQEAGAGPTVGVLAAPSGAISDSQRTQLQQELGDQMQQVPNIQLQTGAGVYDALMQRQPETCVTEPLCLGSVADNAGVDRIVMVRVTESDGRYAVDLDYFDAEERLFRELRSEDDLGSVNAVQKEIGPLVKDLFDLTKRTDPDYAEDDTGTAQLIVGIGAGVLSLGSVAGGAVFGNQAAQEESELKNWEQNDNGVYVDLTQQEANERLNAAQNKAAAANVFYALGGAFAITSGIMFYLYSQSSGAESDQQENADLGERIRIEPTFGREGAGVSAGFRF